MKSVRSVVSAIVVVVALLGASTAPALATVLRPDCPPDQHACCKEPKLMSACCQDGQLSRTDGLPGQARIEVHPNLVPVPAMLDIATPASLLNTPAWGYASPPSSPPLDRPTLFSSLLL